MISPDLAIGSGIVMCLSDTWDYSQNLPLSHDDCLSSGGLLWLGPPSDLSPSTWRPAPVDPPIALCKRLDPDRSISGPVLPADGEDGQRKVHGRPWAFRRRVAVGLPPWFPARPRLVAAAGRAA